MVDFRGLAFLSGRLPGLTNSPTVLAVATVVVFTLALAVSWTTPTEAGCPVCGADYCQNGTAKNPCSMLVPCQPTGPGYTCIYNNEPRLEGYFTVQPTTPWSRCFTPATLSTESCSEGWFSCGTTYHYLSGYSGCPSNTRCVGNWYWEACWGSGNIC